MTNYADDTRPKEALAMDIARIADNLQITGLTRAGRELTGPCPRCGGRDRFSINTAKRVFNCRSCAGTGGNIDLVMFVLGLGFPAALDWLCGQRQQLTPDQAAERAAAAEKARQENAARSERERRRARADAWSVWRSGLPAEGTAVRGYLALRGLGVDRWPELPPSLRYHPDLPYMLQVDREWVEVWRGPAMLAAIQRPDGRFAGVHRTWLDLTRPKGKPRILHPTSGEAVKVKKSLGSVKGGAIRLTPARSTMVVGEGIETTASVLVTGEPPGAGYWAGVSLGNMAGQRRLGQGLKYAGLPDLSDADAWLPPAGTRQLVFLQDGDSEPRLTRAQLEAGLRRAMAMRPGLVGEIVEAPEGMDFNDVLMGQGNEKPE